MYLNPSIYEPVFLSTFVYVLTWFSLVFSTSSIPCEKDYQDICYIFLWHTFSINCAFLKYFYCLMVLWNCISRIKKARICVSDSDEVELVLEGILKEGERSWISLWRCLAGCWWSIWLLASSAVEKWLCTLCIHFFFSDWLRWLVHSILFFFLYFSDC